MLLVVLLLALGVGQVVLFRRVSRLNKRLDDGE